MACTLELARHGWIVFCGVADEEQQEVCEKLTIDQERIHVVVMDVTSEISINSAIERIVEAPETTLLGVVNNAAVGIVTSF